jgi:hypothetical protein
MRRGLVLAALLALAAQAGFAQETKRDTTIHFSDYTRYAGVATYRALDWKTTEDGLKLHCKEVELPRAVVESNGRLALFEGVATAGEIAGSVYLIRHGHRRIAQALDYVSIGVGMMVVSANVHAIHTAESNQSTLVKE